MIVSVANNIVVRANYLLSHANDVLDDESQRVGERRQAGTQNGQLGLMADGKGDYMECVKENRPMGVRGCRA